MKLKRASTVLFLVSITSFPNSFTSLRVVFLLLFLATHLYDCLKRSRLVVYPKLVNFYILFSIAAVLWSLIGLVKGGEIAAVFECVKLYIAWSMVFVLVFTLLINGEEADLLHTSIVLSGILISIVNFAALYDYFNNLWFVTEGMREEIALGFSIHEGYVRMDSVNTAMLFIIVPYLITLQFRRDAARKNTALAKLSLVLCLSLAILSGRRALWLCTAFTPLIIGILGFLSGGFKVMKSGGKLVLALYAFLFVFSLVYIMASPPMTTDVGFIDHIESAFSSEDERTIQSGYLIRSFLESPYLGTGFGAYGGYVRSEDPWKYEMTYHKMLFNLGILGVTFLSALISVYFYRLVSAMRSRERDTFIPFGILVSWLSLLIGAYSNPYFGSFGFMFYFGMLPYLSTQYGIGDN